MRKIMSIEEWKRHLKRGKEWWKKNRPEWLR